MVAIVQGDRVVGLYANMAGAQDAYKAMITWGGRRPGLKIVVVKS